MVSKKQIVISGLMIASLSLTGCEFLTNMLQSKVNDLNKGIADTAKQVSDGVNTAVKDSTDALSAEGKKIQKDALIASGAYINEEFGFSLRFPSAWGNVKAGAAVEMKDTKGVGTGIKLMDITSENGKKTYTLTISKTVNKAKDNLGDAGMNSVGSTGTYEIWGDSGVAGSDTDSAWVAELAGIAKTFVKL